MAVSVRASVLLTTTVSSLFLPCVAMAATSDAENAALRREIAAMHREMMGEIHRLQARVDKYEHVSSLQSHRVGRVPRTLTAGSADDAQPQFREDPIVPVNHGPRSASEANGETGDKQTVWQGGLNWYPNQHIKIMLDYTHFSVSSYSGAKATDANFFGRSGNAVVGRVQAAF